MNYNFTYKETLEHEKHRVFPSDMSKWTMVALAHHKNVIKALERRIPKALDCGLCYECGESVIKDWDYCPCCGQAIDWSKE